MTNRSVFSFLKNLLIFFIERLYREWEYIIRNGQSYSEKASERGDLYVKQLIENITHDRVGRYDPYIVNRSTGISWGRTSVSLGKVEVTGLSTLHRTNICALTEVGNRLFITMNLGAGPMYYRRQITFRYGSFVRKTVALIYINDIKVTMDFSVEKETYKNGFLLDFTINELNGSKLILNGFGYFSWIINLFLSFWTLALRRIIRNLLENELEKYILIKLPKYQFPVEGISYRNGSKLIPREDVQNNKSFPMKENCEKNFWSRLPPINESNLFEPNDSTKYETAKNFVFNQDTTMTSKCYLTNKWISEMNTCQPVPRLGLCSGSLTKNSCNEGSKDKAELKCDPISLLSTEALEISRSLNRIKEQLEMVSQVTNSSSQKITLKNRLKDACLFSDWKILDKPYDNDEIETNRNTSKDGESSLPAKGFDNDQSFLMYKKWGKDGKKSTIQDLSEMSRDSCRDPIKKDSEEADGNAKQSKLLDEIFFEIQERSCRKIENEKLLDAGTKFQTNIADDTSLFAKKVESNEAQVEDLESMKSYDPEIFSGNQSVEADCISDPGDSIDSRTRFKSNLTCDSKQLEMITNKSFDLETDTEREAGSGSTTTLFNKEHGNDMEEISFKYIEVHMGEKINKDPTFETDVDSNASTSNSSENLDIPSKILDKEAVHETLFKKLAHELNEKDIECTDCMAEFSSIAGLKLNVGPNKGDLAETPDPKALHNLLHGEIIARIHKLRSDMVLESDTDDSESSDSVPILSYQHPLYEDLVCDELNLLKDS